MDIVSSIVSSHNRNSVLADTRGFFKSLNSAFWYGRILAKLHRSDEKFIPHSALINSAREWDPTTVTVHIARDEAGLCLCNRMYYYIPTHDPVHIRLYLQSDCCEDSSASGTSSSSSSEDANELRTSSSSAGLGSASGPQA
mmetsp:Transcript_11191/g.34272  ORF Transcript_11191/g.34272 Transcript_11191/m.34272 type:complete len:141 (-) Transcript_11191:720-1142(-)